MDGDPSLPGALLPLLPPRELWAVGLVLVFTLLRPTGKPGWVVAGSLIAGALASIAAIAVPELEPAAWQLLPWLTLALVLLWAAAGRPLRWEPRTGPSAATALLAGATLIHVGLAWHVGGGALAGAVGDYGTGTLTAATVAADATGPLLLPVAWALSLVPGVTPRGAVASLALAAAAVTVVGAAVTARRWGFTGTTRATAAAVAWSPPLLLAHLASPGSLFAAAALVWSWWALGEVWSGRHRPDRMSLWSGALLGAGIGIAVWPVLVLPLWLGRLRGRRAAWFVVGLVGALVAAVAALIPTRAGLGDVWQVAVLDALGAGSVPAAMAVLVLVVAIAGGVSLVPLSPSRAAALSAAVLTLALPWWPGAWPVTGPVVALPFVVLAAVAPDRPEERWPPDAPSREART